MIVAKKLNIELTRKALQSFDFKRLFIEELGWSNPISSKKMNEVIKDTQIIRQAIAELSGALVFEITTPDGKVPESKKRFAIAKEIQKLHHEHVLIFIDNDRKESIWHWLKNQDKKLVSREHFFFRHQPGDGFIAKIASLVIDMSEFDEDGNIAIAEVASRIKSALDIERVVKRFFSDYQKEYLVFLDHIEGIGSEADRRWYASVIINRLMFIYFLQKRLFLDNGDEKYLNNKLLQSKELLGKNKFYLEFLNKLFFEGFAKHETERSHNTNILIGKIKYLNGGLFLEHKIETKYKWKINIPDVAFENLFVLFDRYSWTLDDTPGGADNEMNPDVLGYIFEKYINQKAFGAYYTRTEITEYLCEQTVYKLILDEVNGTILPDNVPVKLKQKLTIKQYDSIAELLLNLDAVTCRSLVMGEYAVLPNLSLLDPACGSGAFLVAAMKTLINVYAAILGKIEFLGDKKLSEWKKQIENSHPSINYYIKKQIITNNLYGVDLMEEATEIAKLRLFLALVASAQTIDQLEPLPNIDFNIMNGNSLIGLMRVDPNNFNKQISQIDLKTVKGKEVQKANLFQPGIIQGNIFAEEHAKSYLQLINEKETAIRNYKNAYEIGIEDLQQLRDDIQESEKKANNILNHLLLEEFTNLGIKFEQVSWDEKKNKEAKSHKRGISINDIENLEPFHWGYEFSEIFRKKDGFDAIITNPPWEIFKPTSKEFFKNHTKLLIQRKMRIEDFIKEKDLLLKDIEIRNEWLNFLSKFPHLSQYFRSSNTYKHQTSIISERKSGSDINLYKLFLEQSFNLLKQGGRCGIVIPSGIYLDAGNKELRNLLFSSCAIENLYGVSNEKFIFEEVEHNIKFTFLSFMKGGRTDRFNVCFRINPRVAVSIKDLDFFLSDPTKNINISIEQVNKLSPTSLAIPELKNETELKLLLKLSDFPLLGEDTIKFGNEFHMTNDSDIFKSEANLINTGILCEGKTIHQYQYKFSHPRYWININDGRKRLLGRKEDNGQELTYQRYRIAFRGIARATDSRTMIATIIPPNSFTSNSLAIVVNDIELISQLYFLGIFNSMTFDFTLRSKISSNLNFFYIYNLSFPLLKPKEKWYSSIVERVAKLICITEDFAELWEKVINSKWSEKVSATQEYERNQLRAELDGIIAHIYGLTEEEFAYILSTFPIVPQPQKVASQNAYRDVVTGLIK